MVDRGDLPLFRPLQNARTTVVAKEEVLPLWVRRLDTLRIGLRSNVWFQARGLPIRGWLVQQLVKLAVAEEVRADILVHADSDVVLLRTFSVSSIVDDDGRVRLYARPDYIDEALPNHVRWHRSAERLLRHRAGRPADTGLHLEPGSPGSARTQSPCSNTSSRRRGGTGCAR